MNSAPAAVTIVTIVLTATTDGPDVASAVLETVIELVERLAEIPAMACKYLLDVGRADQCSLPQFVPREAPYDGS